MILNQKGFTLTQTLISVGLAGGLALIIVKSQETSLLTRNKSNDNQTVNEVVKKVQNALKDKATCSFSLGGHATGDEITQLTKAQSDPNNFQNYIPKKLDNDPTKNLVLVESNKELASDIMVTKMLLVQKDGLDYLQVNFDLDTKNRKKTVGGKTITKLFPLNITRSSGTIVSCYTETDDLLTVSENEVCKDMRGVRSGGKCDYVDGIVDKTPASCPPNSSFKLEAPNGLLKVTCVPCTLTKKFIRYNCEQKLRGVNWLNICYYKSTCSGIDTDFGHEFWEVGGTKARGGDTGSEDNCYDKRRKCWGEP